MLRLISCVVGRRGSCCVPRAFHRSCSGLLDVSPSDRRPAEPLPAQDTSPTSERLILPGKYTRIVDLFSHVQSVVKSRVPDTGFQLDWTQLKVAPPAKPGGATVSRKKKRAQLSDWRCSLRVSWPVEHEYTAHARRKQDAADLCKELYVRDMMEQGMLDSQGRPKFALDSEDKAARRTLHRPPLLQIDPSMVQQVGQLHRRMMSIQGRTDPEMESQTTTMANPELSDMLLGGSYREWDADRMEARSRDMLQRLHVRERLSCLPESRQHEIATKQRTLPINDWRSRILESVQQHRVIVLRADTGSGKSTQLPQLLLDSCTQQGRGAWCNVLVAEPRRIAATSLAQRVAQERGEKLQESIGYHVRLGTRLLRERGGAMFCTTGMLLARMKENPDLLGVSHVIVDEVHERSVETDLLLLLLKQLLARNSDIKLVLMSASLDSKLFSGYFDGAPVIEIPGRMFPVRQLFLEDLAADGTLSGRQLSELKDRDQLERPRFTAEPVAGLLARLDRSRSPGAMLVFLEGTSEIREVERCLRQLLPDSNTHWILPVYGRLTSEQQERIFSHTPPDVRKIVLATNVAETGITVDGVRYVIDTGAVKMARLDAAVGINSLQVEWISKSSVSQRLGRAGRVCPGECYHLYSRRRHALMERHDTPNLLRSPLESVVLYIKNMLGVSDVSAGEFLSCAVQPPSADAVDAAVSRLTSLRLLTSSADQQLTPLGKLACRFDMDPPLFRVLFYGALLGCLKPVSTLVAFEMSGRQPYDISVETRPRLLAAKRRFSTNSDHQVAVQMLDGFQEADKYGEGQMFCDENMISRRGMFSVKGLLRSVFGQLQASGLLSILKHRSGFCDSNSGSWDVALSALVAGYMSQVAYVRAADKRGRSRNRKSMVYCGRVGCAVVGDSVNRSVDGSTSPLLFYANSFHSTQRGQRVLRETSVVSTAAVAIFHGNSLQIQNDYHGDDDAVVLKLSTGQDDYIKLRASYSTAKAVHQLREMLDYVSDRLLRRLIDCDGVSIALGDDDPVSELHRDTVNLVAELLTNGERVQTRRSDDGGRYDDYESVRFE